MENKEFEEITISNIWLKENILDIVKAINQNEIIAEGGLEVIPLNEGESVEMMRLKINALKTMKAYILQLRDNAKNSVAKLEILKVDLRLKRIKINQELLLNDVNDVSHENNYYLSPNFQTELNKLRTIKSLLLDGCGNAGFFMPIKDPVIKGQIIENEEEDGDDESGKEDGDD